MTDEAYTANTDNKFFYIDFHITKQNSSFDEMGWDDVNHRLFMFNAILF